MTTEQLDEIENRQAAAMWIGGPTAAFAQDTLLLVKALREALARCETLRDLADEKAHDAGLYARRMGQAQKALREASAKHNEALDMCQRYMGQLHKALEERDEARSEVERLNRELQSHDCTHRDTPWLIHCPIDKPCSLHRIERLREALKVNP